MRLRGPGINKCSHFVHSVAFNHLRIVIVFPERPLRGNKLHMLNEQRILSHEASCAISVLKLSPFNFRVIFPGLFFSELIQVMSFIILDLDHFCCFSTEVFQCLVLASVLTLLLAYHLPPLTFALCPLWDLF